MIINLIFAILRITEISRKKFSNKEIGQCLYKRYWHSNAHRDSKRHQWSRCGITTAQITYDNVIGLYFSVKPEYRKNAVWMMNDETALALRTLKDSAGNYLWRDSDDSILSKKVIISEYMPNAELGSKPIAFGDFSYYWVIGRSPVSVRTLSEKFALNDQIGYLAFEFLDGKLIRPDAIKVLQIDV